MSASAVWNAIRLNNEPAKNHTEYGRFPAPLAKSSVAGRPLWLIAKHENSRAEVFTIHPGSVRETLPIFSHEEEAQMFLWLGAPGAGWRTRETTARELVWLLCGPYADVGKVALDPVPLFGGGRRYGRAGCRRLRRRGGSGHGTKQCDVTNSRSVNDKLGADLSSDNEESGGSTAQNRRASCAFRMGSSWTRDRVGPNEVS